MDAAVSPDITERQMNGLGCGRAYGTVYNGTLTSPLRTRTSQKISLRSSGARLTNGNDVSNLLVRWALAPDFALPPITSTHVVEAQTDPRDPRTDLFTAIHPKHREIPNHRKRSVLGTNSKRHETSLHSWVTCHHLRKVLLVAVEGESGSRLTHLLLALSLPNNSQNAN
jgi:hypothetical protein